MPDPIWGPWIYRVSCIVGFYRASQEHHPFVRVSAENLPRCTGILGSVRFINQNVACSCFSIQAFLPQTFGSFSYTAEVSGVASVSSAHVLTKGNEELF